MQLVEKKEITFSKEIWLRTREEWEYRNVKRSDESGNFGLVGFHGLRIGLDK